jgi:hypothetical protein
MTPLAVGLTAAAALFAGISVARHCLGKAVLRSEKIYCAAVGIALGLGWSGAGVAARVVLQLHWLVPATVLAGIGLTATLASRRMGGSLSLPVWSDPFSPRVQVALWVLAGFAGILFATFLVEHHLRNPEGGYDAWAIWNSRARFLARGGEATAFWHGNVQADYPFLVPALVAQGFRLVGREAFAVPGGLSGLFVVLASALLVSGVARLRGATAGLLAAALLLSTPIYFTYAWAQYADEPLGTFVLVAALGVVFALDGHAARSSALLILAGAAASMAAWCKNEGALTACALAAALLLPRRETPSLQARLRGLLWFAVGAAPLLLLLIAYKVWLAPQNYFIVGQGAESLARLTDAHRYFTIAAYFAGAPFRFADWGLALLAVPLLLLSAVWTRGPQSPGVRALGAALLICLAGIALVYLLTPMPLAWQLTTSADRLLLQLWPTALLFVALASAPGSPASVSTVAPSR